MVEQSLAEILGINPYLLAVILVWIIIWKGLALWKAARMGRKAWFIILLVVNTVGILEILYLYVFSEIKLGDGKMGKANNIKTRKKK